MAFIGTGPGRSRAAEFGSNFDTGISQGIQNILSQKLDKLQEAAAEKKFLASGFSPQDAKLLAMQRNNPSILGKLLPQYGSFSGQEPQQQEQSQLQQFNPYAQQQEAGPELLQQLQNQQQPNGMMDVQKAYEMLSNPMSFAQQRMGQVPQQMQPQRMQQPQSQQSMQGQIRQQIPQQMQQQPQVQRQMAQPQQQPQYRQRLEKKSADQELAALKKQEIIVKQNKGYTSALEKRATVLNSALPHIEEMMNLLETGNVQSGFFAGNVPASFRGSLLSPDSDRFANLGDDVAESLSGLSTGQQTISKINFNRQRKANLSQSHETQVERVNDAANLFSKIALEVDVADYLINKNNGEPEQMSTKVRNIINKIESEIPEKPRDAQQGQTFEDPQTGVIWRVQGPIMRFAGFAGENNGR